MVKVLVLGSTGMLGNAVGKYFGKTTKYDTYLTYRNPYMAYGNKTIEFDVCKNDIKDLPFCDYYINCIGTIKPYMAADIEKSIYTNSIFPHKLANMCVKRGIKLIHITTDCVFSGKHGSYTENSPHDCMDDYGKSKSLGEPKNCMLLRTSVIGEEIHKNVSLIEWAKSMKGREINGFENHHWNGVTTHEYARICDKIISHNMFEKGLFHVFSDKVSKYELITYLNEKFDLNLKINKHKTPIPCDRSLSSEKYLNNILCIPSVQEQINNL